MLQDGRQPLHATSALACIRTRTHIHTPHSPAPPYLALGLVLQQAHSQLVQQALDRREKALALGVGGRFKLKLGNGVGGVVTQNQLAIEVLRVRKRANGWRTSGLWMRKVMILPSGSICPV